jgi:hypothetical protein
MFRCQATGEVSDAAEYAYVDGVCAYTNLPKKVLRLIKPAEKPIKVVVKTRPKSYTNFYRGEEGFESTTTTGEEIVKELLVREKNLHKVKNR